MHIFWHTVVQSVPELSFLWTQGTVTMVEIGCGMKEGEHQYHEIWIQLYSLISSKQFVVFAVYNKDIN